MRNAQHKISKLWQLLRQGKIVHIFILSSEYLPRSVFSFNVFYIITLDLRKIEKGRNAEIETSLAGIADLDRLCQIENKRRLFLDRFNQNHICILAQIDGYDVGYCWICLDGCYFDDKNQYFFNLNHGMWLYDVLVLQEYRGRGVYRSIIDKLDTLAIDVARPRIYALVEYVNEVSLAAHLRLGFNIYQKVIFFSLFGINLHYIRKKSNRVVGELRSSLRKKSKFSVQTEPTISPDIL